MSEWTTEVVNMHKTDISGSKFQTVNAERLNFDDVNLAGTRINNANLRDLSLNDVNMTGITISDANLTGMSIDGAQWGGAHFKQIGYGDKDRPGDEHTAAKPPVRITSCNMEDAVFRNTNLRGVSIEGCDIEGLTIDGIDIAALLRQHKANLE